MTRRDVLRLALAACVPGCGPALPGGGGGDDEAIDWGLPLLAGGASPQLALVFASTIGTVARLEARDAAEEHWIELGYGVASLVTTIQGVGVFPAGPRRVVVHDRPFLVAPHALHQLGYVDLGSPGRDVHVVLGPGAILPDLLHQLAHAYWYPYEVWDQAPTLAVGGQVVTLWSEVLARQATLVSRLKFLRGVP